MFTELQYKETTEANFIKRRHEWLRNLGTTIPPIIDPYIEIFSQDQEILHIKADPRAYETDAWGEYAFTCFAIPIYTQLFSIIFCWPCAIPVSKYSGDFNLHANARHLILRENSLVYRVDQGDMLSLNLFDGACFELSRFELTRGIELVFSLDDEIDIVKHQRDDSCSDTDDVHIVYKGKPIAIMRNPQNLDEFIQKFHAQVEIANKSKSVANIDQIQRKIHELILTFEQKIVNTP